MTTTADGEEPDDEIESLFARFLDELERGRDVGEELLAEAGERRAELAERMRHERELRALARTVGASPATPALARRFGRFEILDTLGTGGLGRVYLAHDPKLGRKIALKLLSHGEVHERSQTAWILNEARSLASLSHPGVVQVFEVGEVEGSAYVAMQLLPGPSLAVVIAAWKALRDGAAATLPAATLALAERLASNTARITCLAHLAEALAHCHARGLMHRDVKPANVLFDEDARPVLIDFGLAHHDAADEDSSLGLTQKLVGTAAYVAPEQVENERTGADARSDQFAFGTLAYECFALENPFQRKNRPATLDAVARAAPPALATRAAVPPDLARVIHHALEREPGARYPDLAALAADLRAILDSRPISVAEPSPGHLAALWLRRHKRAVAVAGAALALVLALWGTTWALATFTEARAVRAALAGLRPETFEEPDELDRSFETLQGLQQRARRFDAGALRRRVAGPLAPRAEETVHAWSRRLGELLERDRRRSAEEGLALQDMIYRRLAWAERVLCPECPYNLETRARGSVVYPEEQLAGLEVELTRLSVVEVEGDTPLVFDLNLLSAFRPCPMVDLLVPGTYRLQAWTDGRDELTFQSVFFVGEGWPQATRVELVRPVGDLVARCVSVQRTDVELVGGRGRWRIAKTKVLDRLVTIGEFQEYVKETRNPPPEFLESTEHDDAAAVTFSDAMSYAAWAGGRLPTYSELLLAKNSGALNLAAAPSTSGEFVLDRAHPTEAQQTAGYINYSNLDFRPVGDREIVARPTIGSFIGFRVAFDSDLPAYYSELARAPLLR
jgi:tRNA A-37 threonylcarbamoyl transferase component Bud32